MCIFSRSSVSFSSPSCLCLSSDSPSDPGGEKGVTVVWIDKCWNCLAFNCFSASWICKENKYNYIGPPIFKSERCKVGYHSDKKTIKSLSPCKKIA